MIQLSYHRLKNAIRFKENNANNTWIILGQSTPWADDNAPPAPSLSATTVPNKFAAVKATVKWVKEDNAGTIIFNDAGTERKFIELANEAAVLATAVNLVKVMLTATINANLLAVGSFRAIGFATDLVPSGGYEGETYLTSAHISDWGQTETLEHLKPINVIADTTWEMTNFIEY